MAADFTVIMIVRQRFGDGDYRLEGGEVELEAPFVGSDQLYHFSCPNVDTTQMAVLQFESFGLTRSDNTITINDKPLSVPLRSSMVYDVSGSPQEGTTAVRSSSPWKSHTVLIDANVLEAENTMHISSVVIDDDNNYDNFILDNMVIFFKTRSSGGPGILGEIKDVDPG